MLMVPLPVPEPGGGQKMAGNAKACGQVISLQPKGMKRGHGEQRSRPALFRLLIPEDLCTVPAQAGG